jgi:hypothetical protein
MARVIRVKIVAQVDRPNGLSIPYPYSYDPGLTRLDELLEEEVDRRASTWGRFSRRKLRLNDSKRD